VFADVAVYNPSFDLVCQLRFVAEMPVAGGVMTSYELETSHLYEKVTPVHVLLKVAIGCFYCYYLWLEGCDLRRKGLSTFCSQPKHWMMLVNICLYFSSTFLAMWSNNILPDSLAVDSADFVPQVLASLRTRALSVKLNAANTFLNWFKMITYLSYAPSFAVLTDTLVTAAPEIFGFTFVFFIIFYGFAQVRVLIAPRVKSKRSPHTHRSLTAHSPPPLPCARKGARDGPAHEARAVPHAWRLALGAHALAARRLRLRPAARGRPL
jgi:hypothetical protein